MPPRRSQADKAREDKSTAPSPSPAASSRSSRQKGKQVAEVQEELAGVNLDGQAEDAPAEDDVPEPADAAEEVEEASEDVPETEEAEEESEESGKKLTMAERMQKLKDLRTRMNKSSADNRKDLIADHQKSKVTAKELQRLEKQKKLAQTLRLKAEAEENGEDMERKKAWEWSIEQNERWEAKMAEQAIRGDNLFHNASDDAHKKYNKNLRTTKADLVAYERQKEAALGLAPGTLVPINATSTSIASSSRKGLSASEDLYRGADTLSYGDSKPSEDAIDRVVGKINQDMGKVKRKKKDDGDEEITYINERNKVFNKKVARYFDKYTKEIRANFERGTAL